MNRKKGPGFFRLFAVVLLCAACVLPSLRAQPQQVELFKRYGRLREALVAGSSDPAQVLRIAGQCSSLVRDIWNGYRRNEFDAQTEAQLSDVVTYLAATVANARLATGDTTGATRMLGMAVPYLARARRGNNDPAGLVAEFVLLSISLGASEEVQSNLLGEDPAHLATQTQNRDVSHYLTILASWLDFRRSMRCARLLNELAETPQGQASPASRSRWLSGIKRAVARQLIHLARELFDQGKPRRTESLFDCAFQLAASLSDTALATDISAEAGYRLLAAGEFSSALKWLQTSERLASRLEDRNRLVRAIKLQFVLAYRQRHWAKASEIGERLLAVSGAGTATQTDLKTLVSLMHAFSAAGRFTRAEVLLPAILARCRELHDPKSGETLVTAVEKFGLRSGRAAQADSVLKRLVECSPALHTPEPRFLALYVRARLLVETGELEKARSLLDGALQRTGDLSPARLSRLYLLRGNVNFRLGLLQEALADYESALKPANSDPSLKSAVLGNYVYVLATLGQFSEAIQLCLNALSDSSIAGVPENRLEVASALAVVLALKGELKKASRVQQECAELSLQVGDSVAYAQSLLNLAANLQRLGQETKAESLLTYVSGLADLLNDRQTVVLARTNLAVLDLARGDLAAADSQFAAVDRDLGFLLPDLRWRVLYQMALLRQRQKRFAESDSLLQRAISVIEMQRNPLSSEKYKLGFTSQRYEVYSQLVANLLAGGKRKKGQVLKAFAVAERSKARVFVELFGAERALKLPGWETSFSLPDSAEGRRMLSLLSAHLPSNCWFVEYVVAPDNAFAFVQAPGDSSIHAVELGVTENWLGKHVRLFYRHISSPGDNTEANAFQFLRVSTRLFSALLSGVLPDSVEHGRLLVVPDGVLFYLPFETLCPPSGEVRPDFRFLPYLVRNWDVEYAPSARAYALLAARDSVELTRDSCRVAVFADPELKAATPDYNADEAWAASASELDALRNRPLPYTREEAELIRSAVGAQRTNVYLGKEACERTFKLDVTEQRPCVLHMASHGCADNKNPERSGVLLASCGPEDDGFLSVGEISSMHLSNSLTVLSCCQTALGKLYRGEGIDGLARAFLLAGSEAVVVTLWNIADRPSSRLMGRFYESIFRDGKDPVEALANVKRDWLGNSLYSHPFFWAPFVFVGYQQSSHPAH